MRNKYKEEEAWERGRTEEQIGFDIILEVFDFGMET